MNWGWLQSEGMDGRRWIRVFGYGISFTDNTKHRMLYSERNGIKKHVRVGKWRVKYLPKSK
jgi:hypothetical protein